GPGPHPRAGLGRPRARPPRPRHRGVHQGRARARGHPVSSRLRARLTGAALLALVALAAPARAGIVVASGRAVIEVRENGEAVRRPFVYVTVRSRAVDPPAVVAEGRGKL